MTKVTLAIPYRGGQTDRDVAMSFVSEYMQEMLPSADFIAVDTEHKTFNRAAARNAAVRKAGSGVVVLCDADTLPEKQPVEAAIEGASNGRLHLPYTFFRGLTRESTLSHYIYDAPFDKLETEMTSIRSTGGVFVIDCDSWWEVGGMDERFQGWGYEDSSFRIAVDTLLGQTVRHEGTLTHFWHPLASEKAQRDVTYRRGKSLYDLYRNANGSPDRIRKIVEVRR